MPGWFCKAALLMTLATAGPALSCTSETEPNEAPQAATGLGQEPFCAKGVVKSGDQDWVAFDVTGAATFWALRLEAPPEVGGYLRLATLPPGGGEPRYVWRGDLDPATGQVQGVPVLLQPGRWYVQVVASYDPLRWRIYGEPSAIQDEPALTSGTDAFATALTGTDTAQDFHWTVSASGSAKLWTLRLQGPITDSVGFELYGPDGGYMFDAGGPDPSGAVESVDLGLTAGTYRLRVVGLGPGSPGLLTASTAAPGGPALAPEPDSTLEHAHSLPPGQVETARLFNSGGTSDTDFYSLDIGDVTSGQVKLDISGPAGKALTANLTSADGSDITDPIAGEGHWQLGPFALPPGKYGLKVNGILAQDETYSLTLGPAQPPVAGREVEPNDRPAFATPMAAGSIMSGDAADGTTDYLDVEAPPGDLRWWTLRITSAAGIELRLYDGQGNVLVDGRSDDGKDLIRSRLPLVPGRNILRVTATGGWTLAVEPADPPGPGDEREPNDDALHATLLAPGVAMRNWMDHAGDIDMFTLPLTAANRVAVEIALPADAMPDGSVIIPTRGRDEDLAFSPDPVDPTRVRASWTGILPAGTVVLRLRGNRASAGQGQIGVTLSAPFDPPAPGGAASLAPDAPTFAADDARAQRQAGVANFQLAPGQVGKVGITGWVSDGQWRLAGLPPSVELTGQEVTLPFRLEAPPYLADGEGEDWAIVLTDPASGATLALADGHATARSGAEPVDPAQYATLPGPMLGALDAARTDFGATVLPEAALPMFDGQWDGSETSLPLGAPVEIDLAGETVLPILGVVLTPAATGKATAGLRRFRIEVATVADFAPIFEGEIDPTPAPQSIAFPAAVVASRLRLVPLSTWGANPDEPASLSELSVLVPAKSLPLARDLALPELGGHVITASATNQTIVGESAGWPGSTTTFANTAGPHPEWVIGFLDGRAAALSRITVVNDSSVAAEGRISSLSVFASLRGPLGPWTPLGDVTFDAGLDQGDLTLNAPTWARAVRFVATAPATGTLYLPASVAIIEDRTAEGGGSILGAWGDGVQDAVYEQLHTAVDDVTGLAGGKTADTAPDLAPATAASGQVSSTMRSLWYRLTAPPDAVRLVIKVQTDGAEVVLRDAAGDPVALVSETDQLVADVDGRPGPFLLQVARPKDAIVIAWDTSGSVSGFSSAIFAAVQDMAGALALGDTTMNFVPFRATDPDGGGGPLLKEFARDAGSAWAALNLYDGQDSDSDSEAALIVAAHALAFEPGRHAVVLITDGSFLNVRTTEAWDAIQSANLRIYALRVPSGTRDNRARAQANLMQDWADFNGGEHRLFADPADARAAFRALAADLRRPVPFRLVWQFETKPAPPGHLSVTAVPLPDGVPRTGGGRAIEVILDASGSMLQRVGGKRKIELAKAILQDLTDQTLPQGTPFSLRVFGIGGRGSCDGEAVLPLGPLDPKVAGGIITKIKAQNGAKTAIGASLRDAASDLAGVNGERLIVLITDGEETCGGDPEAEIRKLKDAGLDVRLNIVGFDLDNPALKDLFRSWSEAGGGNFFDAKDADGLRVAVKAAVAVEFRVLDGSGVIVAKGMVGGSSVELPAGHYYLTFDDAPDAKAMDVDLRSGETTSIEAPLR